MNMKARLKNKTFLVTFIVAVVAFIYQLLGIMGVIAPISQDTVTNLIMMVVNVLVGLGVVIDPTTSGITDGEKGGE